MSVNFEMAISNNINVKDITLISYLSLVSERENLGEEFELPYAKIINDLPIIFNNKSYEANAVKLRRKKSAKHLRMTI